jgi:hypothetical protein
MKTAGAQFLIQALAACAAALLAQKAASQVVLYENASTDNGDFNLGKGPPPP